MNKTIISHFRNVDPILFSVIAQVEEVTLKMSTNYFSDLCEAIVNQQLSEKAGSTIFNRFKALFPHQKITAKYTVKLTNEKIRQCGISGAKTNYITDLAQKVHSGELKLERLEKLDNQTIIKELTKVKGIGPWTAEMFLMFSLGREDVFSKGDLGLRKAIQKLYAIKKPLTDKYYQEISTKWSPYRTYACMILWKSLSLKK